MTKQVPTNQLARGASAVDAGGKSGDGEGGRALGVGVEGRCARRRSTSQSRGRQTLLEGSEVDRPPGSAVAKGRGGVACFRAFA